MGQWQQFGQLRPADTNAAALFTPTRGWKYKVRILVANTSVGAALYRIFHDNDGATYDQTTALAYDVSLATAARIEVPTEDFIYLDNEDGRIAVRTDTGNALTFTAYGEREKK